MRLPYIQFVIGMLDAPQIDHEASKKKKQEEDEKEETTTLNSAEDEMAFFGGL